MLMMTEGMAMRAIQNYSCSNCWGSLIRIPDKASDGWIVRCRRCQEDTRGLVSNYYIEKRRQQDHFARMEVSKMLADIGVIDLEKKTEAQIMAELGFGG